MFVTVTNTGEETTTDPATTEEGTTSRRVLSTSSNSLVFGFGSFGFVEDEAAEDSANKIFTAFSALIISAFLI